MVKAWDINYPTLRVCFNPFLQSLGTEWGELLFTGIGYFQGVDGYIYVETGATLAEHMVEILHSEYLAAKKAIKEAA